MIQKRKHISLFLAGILMLSLLMPSIAYAKNDEKQIIRVGYYESAGFQEYDADTDTYSGYSYEFLKALQQYGDWSYEFVPCGFSEGLEMLANGEIDIMNNVSRTEEREQIYDFTSLATGENIAYLAMKAGDTRVAYEDFDAMEQIKIGLAKDSIYSDRLTKYFEEKKVKANIAWYDSHEELSRAFASGAVDAYVITSSSVSDEHIILSFEPDSYYIAAKKGNREIVSELDQAITALRQNDSTFEDRINHKYYSQITENYTVLTNEEEAYIAGHPAIKVLYLQDWYPICYADKNGEFAGALRSVYDLLEERTGLTFEYIQDDGSDDIIEKSGMQVMCEQPTDFSRADKYGVRLTKSFVTTPLMEVSTNVMKPGDTLILVEGDYLTELVEQKYGNQYQYQYCDSIEECLKKVMNGDADGTVLISYESEFYRQQAKYSELRYTIIDVNSYGLSIAVVGDEDPALYSIIQKGLNSISDGEISNIFNQTLYSLDQDGISTVIYKHPMEAIVISSLFAVILAVAVLAFYFVRKLKRQNDIIHQKNIALQNANDETTNFLSRMSHDMRTPMNGILGISRLSMEEKDDTVLRENMEKIENSGEYLLHLINDTLDFQKIESGKMELHSEVCDFGEIIRNIIEMNKTAIEEKKLTFQVSNPDSIASKYVYLDSVRFKQIFMNLLSNAIKFTPEGGTVVLKHECLGVEGEVTHDVFYISDTGIGISKEFMEQNMFHPFVQEQTAITNQYAGSGLGLSIVKSLVELMNGEISVKSELGSGTTFIIHMDITHLNQEQAEKELVNTDKNQKNDLEKLKNKTILLVEDHPLNAEIAKKILEKAGCRIAWVDDGQKAVEAFEASEVSAYNAVLMDVRMPVMDGLQATKEIRKLPRQDAVSVPIIAMTANAYETDVQNCLDAGMTAHIAKPIDINALYRTLIAAMN